jgi:glycerol-3-phosphate dehydrogenase
MDRRQMIERLDEPAQGWDVLVIGGGATGLGVALDAAARGYRTALVERGDFGQGTSSRSTKLVHGGIRYLQQGDVRLVLDALRERAILMALAPHLVRRLPFVVPGYYRGETLIYGIGLKLYDLLASRHGLSPSHRLSVNEIMAALPTIRSDGLRGGVQYEDGLFDDARLLIALARTAVARGAAVANYVQVEQLLKGPNGLVTGAVARDLEDGRTVRLRAKVVINATGPFGDALRSADNPAARPLIAPSQGAHLVLPRRFLPGDAALVVPRTPDGRVLFAIPWHDHVVVGTTDTPLAEPTPDPRSRPEEVDFLLDTAAGYLSPPVGRSDVLSTFAGVRPLVRRGAIKGTAALARDHYIEVSASGLVTICGGKWTTYRRMAEDTVDRAARVGGLPRCPCLTRGLPIHGHRNPSLEPDPLAVYGADADAIRELASAEPDLAPRLHPELPILTAQVAWAARHEMARTVEDVLCRRTRAAFLNAPAALAMAPTVAGRLAAELGRDESWAGEQVEAFRRVAETFLLP